MYYIVKRPWHCLSAGLRVTCDKAFFFFVKRHRRIIGRRHELRLRGEKRRPLCVCACQNSRSCKGRIYYFFPRRKLIAFYGNQWLFQFVNSLVVLLVLEHSIAERSIVCHYFKALVWIRLLSKFRFSLICRRQDQNQTPQKWLIYSLDIHDANITGKRRYDRAVTDILHVKTHLIYVWRLWRFLRK